MIELILSPQRSEKKVDYEVDGDTLKVIMNDEEEIYDFTDLGEGKAEDIEVENIEINPVVSIEKEGDTIYIEAIRYYSADKKEEFENGKI